MSTVRRFGRHGRVNRLARNLAAFAAAALVAVAACKDSNTIAGAPSPSTPTPRSTPSPTPTPLPAASIAGEWTGTYEPSDHSLAGDCDFEMPAQAIFTVDGSDVFGVFNAQGSCGLRNEYFQGTTQGNTIAGSILRYPVGSSVTGTISGSNSIELSFSAVAGSRAFTGGRMHLHR